MSVDSLNLPAALKAKLGEAVQRIVEMARPQLVILFGSYAEGKQHEGSDVDLLVVAETESRIELAVRLREALEPVLSPLEFVTSWSVHRRGGRSRVGYGAS